MATTSTSDVHILYCETRSASLLRASLARALLPALPYDDRTPDAAISADGLKLTNSLRGQTLVWLVYEVRHARCLVQSYARATKARARAQDCHRQRRTRGAAGGGIRSQPQSRRAALSWRQRADCTALSSRRIRTAGPSWHHAFAQSFANARRDRLINEGCSHDVLSRWGNVRITADADRPLRTLSSDAVRSRRLRERCSLRLCARSLRCEKENAKALHVGSSLIGKRFLVSATHLRRRSGVDDQLGGTVELANECRSDGPDQVGVNWYEVLPRR